MRCASRQVCRPSGRTCSVIAVSVLIGVASAHGAHALMALFPFLMIALVIVAGEGPVWLRQYGSSWSPRLLLTAVMLSVVSATVHLAVSPEHFREGLVYGCFFAASAAGHVLWAGLALRRPRRWLIAIGLATNLGIVALWVMTRTLGIPLGPSAGKIEAVGVLDVVATACELGVVICCAWLLICARRRQRWQVRRPQAQPARPTR